jgi:hypothetical protein
VIVALDELEPGPQALGRGDRSGGLGQDGEPALLPIMAFLEVRLLLCALGQRIEPCLVDAVGLFRRRIQIAEVSYFSVTRNIRIYEYGAAALAFTDVLMDVIAQRCFASIFHAQSIVYT